MWGFGPACTIDKGLGIKCHWQLSESDVQGCGAESNSPQNNTETHGGWCRSLHHGSSDTHMASWASTHSRSSQALLFSTLVKSQLSHRWLLSALPTKMQTPDNNGLQSPVGWRPTVHSPTHVVHPSSHILGSGHTHLLTISRTFWALSPFRGGTHDVFPPPGMFLSPCFSEQVFLTL